MGSGAQGSEAGEEPGANSCHWAWRELLWADPGDSGPSQKFFSIAKLPQERSGCSQEGSAPRPIPKSFPMVLTSGAFPAEPGALVQREPDTGRAPQPLDSRRKAVPGAWGPPTRGYDKPRALMLPGDPSGSAGADGNSLVPRGSSQR